jgi:hypothetical protein
VEICTVGSVRGESIGTATVDLNGHEAGNGGYSQGRTYRTLSSPLLGEMSGKAYQALESRIDLPGLTNGLASRATGRVSYIAMPLPG